MLEYPFMKRAFIELYYLVTHLVSHKITFARVGFKMRLPLWLILTHDITKLFPSEILQYIRYGEKRVVSWTHYRHSKHHWQYWNGQPIPKVYTDEMIADWNTASIEKHENTETWYQANKSSMMLSAGTADYIERTLYQSPLLEPGPVIK